MPNTTVRKVRIRKKKRKERIKNKIRALRENTTKKTREKWERIGFIPKGVLPKTMIGGKNV